MPSIEVFKKSEHVWERISGEPGKAYVAFATFRDLGPNRDINKAVAKLFSDVQARPPANWSQWKKQFSWERRAYAYDLHNERMAREVAQAQVLEDRKEALKSYTDEVLTRARRIGRMADELANKLEPAISNIDPNNTTNKELAILLRTFVDMAGKAHEAQTFALGINVALAEEAMDKEE